MKALQLFASLAAGAVAAKVALDVLSHLGRVRVRNSLVNEFHGGAVAFRALFAEAA